MPKLCHFQSQPHFHFWSPTFRKSELQSSRFRKHNIFSTSSPSLHLHLLYIQIQNIWCPLLSFLLLLRRPPTRRAPLWNTVPDMMSLQRKRKYNDRSHSYNKKDLTLQVFKKNTKMIYIRSLLQEYTITKTDKRKCTNQ